jgi:uncharacterized protein (TIRG00374 family)
MIWKKKRFWGILIGLGLLAFCIKDVTMPEIRSLMQRLDFFLLIPSVAGAALFILFRALRWKLMVQQHKDFKTMHAVSMYCAGQMLNMAMPMLTGQVGRMFLFSKRAGLKKTFVFSTVILEVLFDAIALITFLVLISLAFAFPDEYRHLGVIVSMLTVIVLILLYVILHYSDSLQEFSKKRLRNRWPGFYVTVRKFLMSFTKGIKMLKSTQHMAGTLLLSFLSWGMHTISIFFLLRAFGFHLPLATAATVMVVNTIALMVPITPGNAGTFEIAVSRSLTAFSVPTSDAVLFALALHLIDILPIFSLGIYFARIEKISIRDIKKAHDEATLLDKVSEEGEFVENDAEKEKKATA